MVCSGTGHVRFVSPEITVVHRNFQNVRSSAVQVVSLVLSFAKTCASSAYKLVTSSPPQSGNSKGVRPLYHYMVTYRVLQQSQDWGVQRQLTLSYSMVSLKFIFLFLASLFFQLVLITNIYNSEASLLFWFCFPMYFDIFFCRTPNCSFL